MPLDSGGSAGADDVLVQARTLHSGKNYHAGAFRLFQPHVAQQFPIAKLAVHWRYDDRPAQAEAEFVSRYKDQFDETPRFVEQ